MARIAYDVTDASVWDDTPTTRPPATLPTGRKVREWMDNLRADRAATNHLQHHYLLTDAIICSRRLGLTANGRWYAIPVYEGIALRTVKYRQVPPERENEPKYRALTGRGIWLWPGWPTRRGDLVICSGEFDQMNLELAGINAVTSTGGCDGRGWKPEWLNGIGRGWHCKVLFDRGEESHADALAARLRPYARSVRVIHLPADLPTKTDVTDIARERGHSELRRLIRGRSA